MADDAARHISLGGAAAAREHGIELVGTPLD
jgi:hypothetical protein